MTAHFLQPPLLPYTQHRLLSFCPRSTHSLTHTRRSCFAEEYSSDEATPETKKQCPSCHATITNASSGKLLVTLRNEGGLQTNFDLGAMLDEEEFYDRNPEFKKIRAFLEFCAEGMFPGDIWEVGMADSLR